MPAKKNPRRSASGLGKSSSMSKKSHGPIRREVGSMICFLLFIFTLLGVFGMNAPLIRLLTLFVRSLIGWGFFIFPFTLLIASVILLFHRGKPVAARVTAILLMPAAIASFVFLFNNPEDIQWDKGIFIYLIHAGGTEGRSAGLINGLVGKMLASVISPVGAGIVLFIVIITLFFIWMRLSPVQIYDYIKNREPKYYEEEKPSVGKRVQSRNLGARSRERNVYRDKSGIDVPVYSGNDENEEEEPQKPYKQTAKVGLFPAKPDNILTPAEAMRTKPQKPVPIPQIVYFDEQSTMDDEKPKPTTVKPVEMPLMDFVKVEEELMNTEPEEESVHENPLLLNNENEITHIPDLLLELSQDQKIKSNDITEPNSEKEPDFTAIDIPKVYQYPSINLLHQPRPGQMIDATEELQVGAMRLIEALQNFGVGAQIADVTRGPTVTRYEIELESGTKLARITGLTDDIALALGVNGVNISPIPNKASVLGVEVPNKLTSTVYIRDVIDSAEFKAKTSATSFVIGRDIGGTNIVGDITKLTHLLIAGTTGSGKSVCMNTLIISLLYKAKPDELKFIMIDPKMVELGIYNGLPHLMVPVVTDPKKASSALEWAVIEMDKRFRMLQERGQRDIDGYNESIKNLPEFTKMSRIVIIIDEMADLMMVAKKEVETSIARIAQKARACGMHLILATQRPDANVVTGIIKANIPSRIACKVSSSTNSRIVLDEIGAEKLIGNGDMLYLPNGASRPSRVQGCYVSTAEVERVVSFIKLSGTAQYSGDIIAHIEQEETTTPAANESSEENTNSIDYDNMLPAAVEVIVEAGQGSVSFLQRRLKLGFSRASRLMDMMEARGIVGPYEGSKPRKVLITKEQLKDMRLK